MVTLEIDRFLLRMFCEEDLDAYAKICTDPKVMRFIGGGVASSRSDAWRSMAGMLGHWRLRGYGIWAIEEQASGDLIGRIGLMNPEGWPGIEAT